jgi:hypothetical protein
VENLLGSANFQELAGAHDGDALGDLGHYGQAVRNENIRQREFALELLQREEDLSADGNVERRDGFIGNDELRLEYQGASDADALALAAGEFVGVAAHGVFV